ncbi:MAG: hypothetical protein JW783_00745 [Bacteroidales bacterium]|nr:hypothetical protein [Bacteroidales bacterium]MBN2749639.1 hypothetical protein [Bacteroidales bacterium]
MIKRRHHIIATAFLALLWGRVVAQQDNILFMQHINPQSNLVNPAVLSACPTYFSVPMLGSLHVNANSTGFSYAEISGSGAVNLNSLAQQLRWVDYVTAELHYTLFSMGTYLPNADYFNVAWTEKVDVKAFYPEKLVDFVANGNTQHIGQPFNFKFPGVNAMYYRELSFGLAREVDKQFIVGAHAKLLFGQVGIFTKRGKGTIVSNSTTYNFDADWNFGVNASVPLDVEYDADGTISGVELGALNFPAAALTFTNPGIAVDLGFIYRVGDYTFSGSALDLGFIYWSKNSRKFQQNGTFEFEGANVTNGLDPEAYFDSMVDSIHNQLKVTETSGGFMSFTTPRVYLGALLPLNRYYAVGANIRTELYPGRPVVGLTVHGVASNGKGLQGILSYSVMNGSFFNIGAGVALGGNGFQFFAMSDNLLGLFAPQNARNLNARLGFNIFLGCAGGKKKAGRSYYAGNCSWLDTPKQRQMRKMKKIRRR